uniref:Uncharacterized protein n=1 Tax=Tetradesmus obliquus TaxID=3088 RepID=A0A383WAG8_TETOB
MPAYAHVGDAAPASTAPAANTEDVAGSAAAQPSSVDELEERYYRLIADMPQGWQDAIFGPGRSSYDPYWSYPGSATESVRPRAATVLSPIFTDRVQELAALDALIAQVKALDPPPQGEGSGTMPQGKPGKKSKRGSTASSSNSETAAHAASVESTEDVLQFSKQCFDALQNTLVTPCTVDACASVDGSNALLPDFCCDADTDTAAAEASPPASYNAATAAETGPE